MIKTSDKNNLDIYLSKLASNFPLIINLSNQKGGVGKSTLAYNIADGFRTLGLKVQLLDMDIQHSCMALNALRDNPFNDIKEITNKLRLMEIIHNSSKYGSEVLIIDSSELNPSLSRLAIINSNINITPINDRVTEILSIVDNYSKLLDDIERDTNKDIFNYVILNRVHLFSKYFEHIEDMIKESSQMKMIITIVRDRSIYNESLIDGRTVFEASELKGYKEAMSEILSLCYELIDIYLKTKG